MGAPVSPLGFLDQCSGLDSPLHRLDPRTKLLGLGLFLGAVAVTPGSHWLRHGLQLAVLGGLLVASRVPVGFSLRRIVWLTPFFLFAASGLLLGGSLVVFASLVAKSTLALLAMILLLATTPFPLLLSGLRGLRFPGTLLQVLAFAYRYLLVLGDEGLRMSRAYAARAVGPRNLRQLRSLGRLLEQFFLRTYDRSERIYRAMLARGFDGQFRALALPRWRWTETVWLIGFALGLALVGLL